MFKNQEKDHVNISFKIKRVPQVSSSVRSDYSPIYAMKKTYLALLLNQNRDYNSKGYFFVQRNVVMLHVARIVSAIGNRIFSIYKKVSTLPYRLRTEACISIGQPNDPWPSTFWKISAGCHPSSGTISTIWFRDVQQSLPSLPDPEISE